LRDRTRVKKSIVKKATLLKDGYKKAQKERIKTKVVNKKDNLKYFPKKFIY